MEWRRAPGHRLVGLSLAALTAVCWTMASTGWGVSVAEACGGFFMSKIDPERRPALGREKVLLIHDAAVGRQHFIREVAFLRAKEPFGFVVPTPTRPEVDKVDKQPFTRLRRRFPFAKPRPKPDDEGMPHARGVGSGFGGKGGVTVLETKQVGSFTAFVLAATDQGALSGWLKKNKLVSTSETDDWLAHYVRMGFYYVAMRYDPHRAQKDKESDQPVTAETIRISFDTPVPFYPYLEPKTPDEASGRDRLMELWYVGTRQVVPVALRDLGDEPQWVRPLAGGQKFEGARDEILAALPDALEAHLPEGELVLQTFQDQKTLRRDYGDILFAPNEKRELSEKQITALEPLLGILAPALIPEAN